MAGIAEETTELCENIARIQVRRKAKADEPKEATQTKAVEIAVPNAKFPDDKVANGDGVQDIKDMSKKREKAEIPITMQKEHVHEAVTGQVADQDGHDDHPATATRDKGDGAENFPDEVIQTRPKKPPDTGCEKLKRIIPGLLKTGILLVNLMLTLYPIIMISGPVLMDTSGDDDKLKNIECEFVYLEKDTMGDVGVVYKETELCPTGGLDNILRFEKTFDSGGDAHVPAHIDEGGGAAEVPEGADTAQVDNGGAARVPVEEGGGAVPVPVDDRGGTDQVRVPITDGGGDGPVHTDGGGVMAEAVHGGGHVRVQAHTDEGGGAVQVTKRGDVTKDNENCGGEHVQVPAVEAPEGADMAKHDEGDNMFKTDTSGDGVRARVGDKAELTRQVGTAEGLHTIVKIMMANLNRVDHATIDEGEIVAEEEFEEVQVSVDTKPEVDKDEEGGGDIPTPDDKEAGKLEILMSKQVCFGHERGEGITKCTRLLSCAFMLVGNVGKLGPRGRRQAHLTTAPWSECNTG